MKHLIFLLIFSSITAWSARLDDVQILEAIEGKNNYKLKLQIKGSPTESFFYLDITKADPNSFNKLVHVSNKLLHKDAYKLDLEIPSFSVSPSGSYYKSNDVDFFGVLNKKKLRPN